MRYIVSILGMIFSFFLIKYRERVGDMLGNPEWANKFGGIYNLIVLLAVFLFFFCVATLTGTADVFFRPLLWVIPGAGIPPTPEF